MYIPGGPKLEREAMSALLTYKHEQMRAYMAKTYPFQRRPELQLPLPDEVAKGASDCELAELMDCDRVPCETRDQVRQSLSMPAPLPPLVKLECEVSAADECVTEDVRGMHGCVPLTTVPREVMLQSARPASSGDRGGGKGTGRGGRGRAGVRCEVGANKGADASSALMARAAMPHEQDGDGAYVAREALMIVPPPPTPPPSRYAPPTSPPPPPPPSLPHHHPRRHRHHRRRRRHHHLRRHRHHHHRLHLGECPTHRRSVL